MKNLLTALVMSLVLMLAVSGCKKKTEPAAAPETKPAAVTTAPGATAPMAMPAAAPQKAVPVEQYWEIQIQRLEATKKHYEAILAVYTKYKGDTPEARNEVNELQRTNRDAMQEIFKSRGFSSNDFYPRGPDRQTVLMQRQQYLQGNPELKTKYQALASAIRELRDKVKVYMPSPTSGMPAGQMPPGHPPVPGMTGQPGMPMPGAQPGMPMPGGQPGMPPGHPPVSPGTPMPGMAPAPVAPPAAPAPTAPKAP